MANCRNFLLPLAMPLHLLLLQGVWWSSVESATFTIVNKCRETVWVGSQGNQLLSNGGFTLHPGRLKALTAPSGWQGRFWGRTRCTFDHSGRGSCATGDCGGLLECNGVGGQPPATLAEFSLGQKDFYDVSLVDGYNLQMSVVARGGTGMCGTAGCIADLNEKCPSGLKIHLHSASSEVVACRSACAAFAKPQYCCTGAYASPQTCHSTPFSKVFKQACPTAYSYAYDDPTSTFTCSNANYIITFCH